MSGRLRAVRLLVPALAVVGAVAAAQSLLASQAQGRTATFAWGTVCQVNRVPAVEYGTAYGALLLLLSALVLYGWSFRVARRRGLDPVAGWRGGVPTLGAVVAASFLLVALGAVFAVTVRGAGAGDGYLCPVGGPGGP